VSGTGSAEVSAETDRAADATSASFDRSGVREASSSSTAEVGMPTMGVSRIGLVLEILVLSIVSFTISTLLFHRVWNKKEDTGIPSETTYFKRV